MLQSQCKMAATELRKHTLSPLPGAISEVWKYFRFEKKNCKLIDRQEVSAITQ